MPDMFFMLFLTAPILPTFVASFGRCIKMLMVPCSVLCGTRTRKLFAIAWRPSSIWLMTPTKTRPHKPMLAEWTSEILSLSLSLCSWTATHPYAAISGPFRQVILQRMGTSSDSIY